MAESQINQLNLADLIAAKKNTGPAQALDSLTKGAETGINLSTAVAAKRQAQAKSQADIQARAQELVNKTKELNQAQAKEDANTIPVTAPATLGALQPKGNVVGPDQASANLPQNAPVASYDPNTNAVTPSTVTTKMSPDAFKARNPDIETLYKQAAAKAATTGTPVDPALQKQFDDYRASQVPESNVVVGFNQGNNHIKVMGSKSTDLKDVDLGSGFTPPNAMNATERGRANDIKEQQFDENKLQKFAESAGGLSSGSKSAVGIAAKGNLNADRAIATLSDPKADVQAFQGAISDLAGLYAGGAATLEGLKGQEYNTLQNHLAQLKTLAMSSPQVLQQPEIKAQLVDRLNELKNVNNQLLERNVGIESAGISGAAARNPAKFQKIMDALENSRQSNPAAIPAQVQADKSVPSVALGQSKKVGNFTVTRVK